MVVAILLLLATLAVPALLRARQSANEAAAVSSLKLINGAQTSHLSSNNVFGNLANLSSNGMVDDRYSADGALVGGYVYEIYGGGTVDYAVSASVSGVQGRYNYYTGPDNVIRFRDAEPGSTLPVGKSPGDPVS